jgi:hypothetical protein
MKGQKNIIKLNRDPKQAGVATVISDKADFKAQFLRSNKEGPFILTRKNPLRRDNNYKHICTKFQHTQFQKTSTTRYKRIDIPQHNNSGLHQYNTHTIRYVIQTKKSTNKLLN